MSDKKAVKRSTPLIMRKGEGELLNALGAKINFICAGDETARSWSLAEVTLPQGSGPPPHEHAWDEAYYILQGSIRFTVGNETVVAAEGDFVYVPGGIPHGFQGSSAEPARALIFDAPAASEHFFRDLDKEVRSIPADLPKVPGIGLRHGLRFIR